MKEAGYVRDVSFSTTLRSQFDIDQIFDKPELRVQFPLDATPEFLYKIACNWKS